jgi:hypothetical protein
LQCRSKEQSWINQGAVSQLLQGPGFEVGGVAERNYCKGKGKKCKVTVLSFLTEHHDMKAYGGVEV